MSELILIDRPEKDWKFKIGNFCVLNSGSPILEVIAIKSNGDRVLRHEDDTFEFPSICLRPHFLDRILMNEKL